jgi:hypothetical protein
MSATFGGSRFTLPPNTRTVVYQAPASLVISIGDLLYYDSGDGFVKPLSSKVASGTVNTDQVFVHDNFVGVAQSGRLAAQTTAGDITVATDCIYEAECAAQQWEPGALVTAFSSGAAAAAAISDQKLDATSLTTEAIGVVVRQYKANTTAVECRLYGKAARQVF